MAKYANELFGKFIPDKEVKKAVIVPNPCPENLNQVRRLDYFLVDIIRDKKRAKAQTKVLDVMEPLSKIWLA